jgi:carbonic anhydrase
MTFPFVSEAVEEERVTLHGLWTDVGEGGLLQYEPATSTFEPI